MTPLFLQYPACSTCQKAKKWLIENNIEYTNRFIVEDNPTVEELKAWIPRSGLPIKKFFNTSGLHGSSSVGRAPVSKTGCREFEPLLPCRSKPQVIVDYLRFLFYSP